MNEYISQFGKTVNTDLARRLFTDIGYNGRNSAAVHEASSQIAKDVWKKNLLNKEPDAVIYAGGSGSGKSTAVTKVLPQVESEAAAILDGNLSKFSSAAARIKEADAAGKIPKIIYVYREPVDAWVNGVIKRMLTNKEEGGRVVPLSVFLENAPGSLDVVKKLNQLGADVVAVDNSLGAGNATIMSKEKLMNLSYPANLKAVLLKETKKLYTQKKITKEQYEALIK